MVQSSTRSISLNGKSCDIFSEKGLYRFILKMKGGVVVYEFLAVKCPSVHTQANFICILVLFVVVHSMLADFIV